MAKMQRKTPYRTAWAQIETERIAVQVTRDNLAKEMGYSRRTLQNDMRNPERMTLERIVCYMQALGINEITIRRE